MRAVFFDREPAEVVVAQLHLAGFTAGLTREPFAGEDDDEDHPWAVTSDAPLGMLELLAEEHDGWLDDDTSPAPAAPVELPTGPRRVKREP